MSIQIGIQNGLAIHRHAAGEAQLLRHALGQGETFRLAPVLIRKPHIENQGHIQMRDRGDNASVVFEVVIEQIEFIRNINYERGNQVVSELRKRGRLISSIGTPAEMLENITTAVSGESDHDVSAK